MTVQVDLAIDSNDQVNWKIIDSAVLGVGDIHITTTSSFYNYILKMMHGEILKIVRENLPKAEQAISAEFDSINAMWANRNDSTFLTNILNSSYAFLNLTTTKAPSLDATTGLFSLNFDGLFYNVAK